MLIKSFINENIAKELLNWVNTQNLYLHNGIGKHAYYSLLDELNNHPKIINRIRQSCAKLVDAVYQEPCFKDFVNEVFVTGKVLEHTDPTIDKMRHLRCNIMLQKPDSGGDLIVNGKKIDLNVGDMYVLDTSIPHAVSEVIGNNSYKTIVFGFLCNE